MTISDYYNLLKNLKEKSSDEKTKKSTDKLTALLNILDSKNIFEKDGSKILNRLDIMGRRIKNNPAKAYIQIEFAFKTIINISAKFYGLIEKGYYRKQMSAAGLSLGAVAGIIIYLAAKNIAYFAACLIMFFLIGFLSGIYFDNKAEKGGKTFTIE